jgi:hypothetical protein
VERSFSFGREYASLRRHKLSAQSVTRGISVEFYLKNGKIKRGLLRKWKANNKNENKAAREKSGRKQRAYYYYLQSLSFTNTNI